MQNSNIASFWFYFMNQSLRFSVLSGRDIMQENVKIGCPIKLEMYVIMNCTIENHIKEGILNDRASSASFASRLFPIYLLWHDVRSCEDIQFVCSTNNTPFFAMNSLLLAKRTYYPPCKECPYRIDSAAKKTLPYLNVYLYRTTGWGYIIYSLMIPHINVCIK